MTSQIFIIIDPHTKRGIGRSTSSAPSYEPGDAEVPCTAEQFAAPTAWMLSGSDLVPASPLPDPVPGAVTSAQAKLALLETPGSAEGRTLLDDVEAAVKAAGRAAQIWFSDARTWERANTYVAQIAGVLALDDAKVDALFVRAAAIRA